jgi:NifU-like protein involved in Fe-S cluster formation
VYRGSAGNRERGTWVQFDIQVLAGRCLDARFLAFGCPHTIAVAAWVAEQVSGTTLRAALPEPVAALAQRFAVPAEKLGRLLIVEDAWGAAAHKALTPPGHDPTSVSVHAIGLKEL